MQLMLTLTKYNGVIIVPIYDSVLVFKASVTQHSMFKSRTKSYENRVDVVARVRGMASVALSLLQHCVSAASYIQPRVNSSYIQPRVK